MNRALAGLLAALAVAAALAGCSTGDDAVAVGGEFRFVSPGGRTELYYDPPESRGEVRGLSGESLLEPGRTIGLDDYLDTVVVINIWGSWCGPCRAEAPDLQQVAEDAADDGVEVLGINIKDNRDAAADFITDRGLTWSSIYDPAGRSLLALRGYPRSVVPSTIVLDRGHRVAAIYLRSVTAEDLLPVVRRVAAEPGQG